MWMIFAGIHIRQKYTHTNMTKSMPHFTIGDLLTPGNIYINAKVLLQPSKCSICQAFTRHLSLLGKRHAY